MEKDDRLRFWWRGRVSGYSKWSQKSAKWTGILLCGPNWLQGHGHKISLRKSSVEPLIASNQSNWQFLGVFTPPSRRRFLLFAPSLVPSLLLLESPSRSIAADASCAKSPRRPVFCLSRLRLFALGPRSHCWASLLFCVCVLTVYPFGYAINLRSLCGDTPETFKRNGSECRHCVLRALAYYFQLWTRAPSSLWLFAVFVVVAICSSTGEGKQAPQFRSNNRTVEVRKKKNSYLNEQITASLS